MVASRLASLLLLVSLPLSVFAAIVPQGRKAHLAETHVVCADNVCESEMVLFSGKGHAHDYFKDERGPNYFNDVWTLRIDEKNDFVWHEVTPKSSVLPAARWKTTGGMLHGSIFSFGGHNGLSEKAGMLNDLWRFDLKKLEWTNLTPTESPPPRRASVSAIVYDEEMVVFGGKAKLPRAGTTDKVMCASDTWAALPLPTTSGDEETVSAVGWTHENVTFGGDCRWGHSGDKMVDEDGVEWLVVYGGRDGATGEFYSDMWKFNVHNVTQGWVRVPFQQTEQDSLPPHRNHHASCVIGQKLYVHGGRAGAEIDQVLGDLWEFDFTTRRWTELAPPPPPFVKPILPKHISAAAAADALAAAVAAKTAPDARFLHSLKPWALSGAGGVTPGHMDALVTFGGEQFHEPLHLNDVWVFKLDEQKWKQISIGANLATETGRMPPKRVITAKALGDIVGIIAGLLALYGVYSCVQALCFTRHRGYTRIVS